MEPIKVLLADDSEDDIELMTIALNRMNLRLNISVCKDGAETLRFLFKEREYRDAPTPDLVFLDINMPKLSGLEVLERIKSDTRTSTIPVIMMTLSGRKTDIMKAYRKYANAYVQKPLDFDQFQEAVKKISGFYFTIVKLPGRD